MQMAEQLIEKMKIALDQDNWAEVGDLDRECRGQITKWLTRYPRDTQEGDELRCQLFPLLAHYQDLIERCEAKRSAFLDALRTLRQGKNVEAVYNTSS
jgi:hypothetical protein